MIYFVDEDYRKLRSLSSELTFNGYQTEIIRDADTAYSQLCNVADNEVDLVIIDVMLAVKSNGSSRYSREQTEEYHKTGICLLEDLVLTNPSVFPRKAIFLSHASSAELVAEIKAAESKYGVKYLRKADYDTAYHFGLEVVEIIGEIRRNL